jgi:hypothetical protein
MELPPWYCTETVLLEDAATGETIAESEPTPSTALGSLPNLGYTGRVYMMGNTGLVFIHKVEDPNAQQPSGTSTG